MHGVQVAVVLSEKVDTTLSKGILRVGGTVVGGTLGEPSSCSPAQSTQDWLCDRKLMYAHIGGAVVYSVHHPLSCIWSICFPIVLAKLYTHVASRLLCHTGFAVMAHPDLATDPFALTALVCTATCVIAPITLTVYRYAAFLTLITFHSLILCQYKCAPWHALP